MVHYIDHLTNTLYSAMVRKNAFVKDLRCDCSFGEAYTLATS